jgi:GNAT superfamily N-acetyltransferase
MQIYIIDPSNKRDIHKFVRFPFELYQYTSQWVPPFVNEMEQSVKKQHPFFQHSEADFFLAEHGGKVVGRIAVMNNRRANQFRGTQTAFFGFLEMVDDADVALGLFAAAFEWARQRGLDQIIGPRGLIGSDSSGILVEGFEQRAALSVPYNFPYYDAHIKAAGFSKDTDHLSGYLPGGHFVPERIKRIAGKVKERRGYWIKSFKSKDKMRAWVPQVQAVHREAFEGTHTFYPPTDEEMQSIAETLIAVADPSLIKLVMKGQDVIGFIFAYHDISAGLQKAKGRFWPFGWYHILKERKRAEWVNINGVGMLPQYQGMGGNAILYTELEKSIHAFGFKHMDIVQVNETNFESFNDMEAIGVQWYKRHRSYKRDL